MPKDYNDAAQPVATTSFNANDLPDNAFDTVAEAEAWLARHRRRIEDAMAQRGNETITDLLLADGLPIDDEEDD